MPQRQPTNAYQLRIGDFVLTTLLDAQMEASFGLVQSIPEEEAGACTPKTAGPSRRIGENPSLYPLHLLISRRC